MTVIQALITKLLMETINMINGCLTDYDTVNPIIFAYN